MMFISSIYFLYTWGLISLNTKLGPIGVSLISLALSAVWVLGGFIEL